MRNVHRLRPFSCFWPLPSPCFDRRNANEEQALRHITRRSFQPILAFHGIFMLTIRKRSFNASANWQAARWAVASAAFTTWQSADGLISWSECFGFFIFFSFLSFTLSFCLLSAPTVRASPPRWTGGVSVILDGEAWRCNIGCQWNERKIKKHSKHRIRMRRMDTTE